MNNSNSETSPSARPHADEQQILLLLGKAKAGSVEALEALHGIYQPLIRSCLYGWESQGLNEQGKADLRADVESAFVRAVQSYRAEGAHVTFGLYAKTVLENAAISYFRRLKANRLDVVPLPDDDLLAGEDPVVASEADERYARLVSRIRAMLSAYENQIWWQSFTGASVSEIAARLGKDEKSISNAMYRIRKKLRARLTDEDNLKD